MNIAFDVDGVLTNIEKFQLEVGSRFFQKKYHKDIVNESGYGIKEVFDCTDKQEIEFWTKKTFQYMKMVKPRTGAISTLKKLKEEGNNIFIISSRAMTSNDNILGYSMRKLIFLWLKENHIVYDDIIFCSIENSAEEKMQACLEHGIHIMVEDKKENIDKISEVIPTLCFSTRNNEDYEKENVFRVNNYDDVYTMIQYLKGHSHFQILNSAQRSCLSEADMLTYYQQLKNYYLNLPFDDALSSKKRNQCLKLLKILQPIFNKFYQPSSLNENCLSDYHGVIFAANHLHAFDPLMLTSPGIVDFTLLAKDELLTQVVGNLFKYIGAVFVDNNDPYSKQISKNELIKTILHGYNVMMFPEGTRNKTGDTLLNFKYGTVSVAQITGAPIIPCALNANYRYHSPNLFVNIGNPMYVDPQESLTDANQRLKETIMHLLMEIKENEKVSKTKVK